MAIAYDSVSFDAAGGASPYTVSHTVSGTDKFLLVSVRSQVAGGGDVVTGVTYNGTSMTRINTIRSETNNERGYLYYLINPDTGTHDIVVTASSGNLIAGGASYTGVDQTSPIDANNTSTQGTGTSVSLSVTTTTDNCWLVGYGDGVTGSGSAFTPGSNTTERAENDRNVQFDSNGPQTPTGSYSQNYSWTSNERFFMLIAAIKPAGAAASTFLPRATFL